MSSNRWGTSAGATVRSRLDDRAADEDRADGAWRVAERAGTSSADVNAARTGSDGMDPAAMDPTAMDPDGIDPAGMDPAGMGIRVGGAASQGSS
ncbi:hypothetical protein [Chelatococcus asaccharovorans]|uniref:hypothetical protein n=1 Tax=Chelatococcus asaccharovorans TaxID=28210 RepID=UPI00224C767D|nr:hypothetical protein [Chelatococcus asaccharovorans]CAH1665235.1 hypothetical protein CHELA17_60333 [Chelatococcus asaccharovorans]CAH1682063.1 hypothetical protein CHELA40_15287 [Chelatococcus asaccharovorans]